jgi:hypothetical protein
MGVNINKIALVSGKDKRECSGLHTKEESREGRLESSNS